MKRSELPFQQCSLARTAAIVGDQWTLVILRDAFLKVRRFEDFQRRNGITRRILTLRLRMLVERGIFERVPYQSRPLRHEYRLTSRGRDLYPIILSIVHWGNEHLAEEAGPPVLHRHKSCGADIVPKLVCAHCEGELTSKNVEARPGPGLNDPASLFPE